MESLPLCAAFKFILANFNLCGEKMNMFSSRKTLSVWPFFLVTFPEPIRNEGEESYFFIIISDEGNRLVKVADHIKDIIVQSVLLLLLYFLPCVLANRP